MDEAFWVEVLSPHHHHHALARHRCAGPVVRIGRGYANDIVLDDPYVAPTHMLIRRNEAGALVAEDLGSENGLFLDRGKVRLAQVLLDGDRPIRIGHTWLRVRETYHRVAPERRGDAGRVRWPGLVLLATLVLALEGLSLWLGETTEPRLARYLEPLLTVVAAVAVWTGLWATLCRVFAGQARFERNLRIAILAVLAFTLYDEFAQYVAFALMWRSLAIYEFAVLWCLLGVACFFHLKEFGATHLALKGGLVAGVAVIAIGAHYLLQSEARSRTDRSANLPRLLPPALRLSAFKNEDAFFAEVGQLKAKLDRARREESPSPGFFPVIDTE